MEPAQGEQAAHVNEKLLALLQFEEDLRGAKDIEQLGFRATNNVRSLVNYRQVLLLTVKRGQLRVQAASNVSNVDPESPFTRWLEKVAAQVHAKQSDGPQMLTVADYSDDVQAAWQEHSLEHVLWAPLNNPTGDLVGALWFARETPWQETELPLIQRLGTAVGYSVWAMRKPRLFSAGLSRKQWLSVLAITLVGFLFPIRMSVLAPVEVVAHKPAIVSPSVQGVIASVEVLPNTFVKQGQVLFRLDDTELRNSKAVAGEELEVKKSQLTTAQQGAFSDAKLKSRVAVLTKEIELAQARLTYDQDRLSKTVVVANRDGLLIYSDPADWTGQPVQVGQRIMQIANPSDIRFKIEVPVSDALDFELGADVRAFLNAQPLTPIQGEVESIAYEATRQEDGQLAFSLIAIPTVAQSDDNTLRIGYRGTAKVYGDRVPLFYYIFRRPISATRQYLGF